MNLRGLDLNLLVVLDALLDEAHVSRAAHRIGMSQPAASAALQRCRHMFGDELLERGQCTMRLTTKAQALRAPLKSLLADIQRLIDPPQLPLGEVRATLRVSMADLPADLVLAPLLARLHETMPGLDLVIQPWRGLDAARQGLVEGSTDLGVSVFPGEDAEIVRQELFRERYVAVMRAGHPASSAFDLAAWLRYPHILVSGRGERTTPLDAQLARLGRARRIGLVVPSFQLVPDLLLGSDMIALLPSRIPLDEAAFACRPPPIEVEGFTLHVAWHRRRGGDRVLAHVAGLLAELLR